MPKNLLIIEDDLHVVELLKACLIPEGFNIHVETNGLDGLNHALTTRYDLIILDIMLPDKNGWDICRQLTGGNKTWTPILMLTAKESENDRILGLEMGADDYVTKPFSPRELVARINAIFRRIEQESSIKTDLSSILTINDLTLDANRFTVMLKDQPIILTPKEFDLLYYMIQHKGQVFSREQLLSQIWDYELYTSTRTVDEHIKNLRKKIAEYDSETKFLHTVWGVGYKFEVTK
jgi:two-component system alkaline phosphatase synthesis response regulator PhoP